MSRSLLYRAYICSQNNVISRLIAAPTVAHAHKMAAAQGEVLVIEPVSFSWYSRLRLRTDMQQPVLYLLELLEAHIPMRTALNLATTQAKPRVQPIFNVIGEQIEQGSGIAQACELFGDIFDPVMLIMFHAGQQSGSLVAASTAVREYLEAQRTLIAEYRRMSVAPVVTALGVLAFVLFGSFVIKPHFAQVLAQAGMNIPLESSSTGMVSVLVCIGTVLSALILVRRRIADAIIAYNIHPFARIVRVMSVYRLSLGISFAVRAKVSLRTALLTAQQQTQSSYIIQALGEFISQVDAGMPLAHAARHSTLGSLIPELGDFLAVAEANNDIAHAFNRLTALYAQRAAQYRRFLLNLIQPILFLSLGILVFLLIKDLYVPILQIPLQYNQL